MDDGHSKKSLIKALKNEWALLWDSISFEEGDEEVQELTPEQIQKIIKSLSADRKSLNQEMESLRKEIEINSAKAESLRLVGGEAEDVIKRLDELSDRGRLLSETLVKIDEKLKLIREI